VPCHRARHVLVDLHAVGLVAILAQREALVQPRLPEAQLGARRGDGLPHEAAHRVRHAIADPLP